MRFVVDFLGTVDQLTVEHLVGVGIVEEFGAEGTAVGGHLDFCLAAIGNKLFKSLRKFRFFSFFN